MIIVSVYFKTLFIMKCINCVNIIMYCNIVLLPSKEGSALR